MGGFREWRVSGTAGRGASGSLCGLGGDCAAIGSKRKGGIGTLTRSKWL